MHTLYLAAVQDPEPLCSLKAKLIEHFCSRMQCSLLDISLQLQDNPHFPRSCHTVFFAQNNHLAGWFLCRSFLVQTNMHSNQTRETIRVWWRWFVQPWSSTFHFFIYGPIEANRLFSHLSSSWTEVIFSLILLVSRKNKMKRRLLCKRNAREKFLFCHCVPLLANRSSSLFATCCIKNYIAARKSWKHIEIWESHHTCVGEGIRPVSEARPLSCYCHIRHCHLECPKWLV